MQKSKSVVALARRAWNFLRLALLWARKGGLFKNRRPMMDLRLLPKFIHKTLGTTKYHYHHQRGALYYGERELSFDDTPVMRVKMHRPSSLRFKVPNLPCITGAPAQVDFDDDYDFHSDDCTGHDTYYYHNPDPEDRNDVVLSRNAAILLEAADDYFASSTSDKEEGGDRSNIMVCDQEPNETPRSCDDGIDLKAEQFIANFYQQIKLQRQISYLEYHDMIARGAS